MKLTTHKDMRIRSDLMYKIYANKCEPIDWVNFVSLRSNLELTGPAIGLRGNRSRIR